ncbi:MAG: M48 family metalloprotease [Thermoplasmata archaeon]
MALKTRMAIAISLLFALLFAALMGIVALLEFFGILSGIFIIIVPLVGTIIIITVQWAVSPLILRWIYKIEWVEPSYFDRDIEDCIKFSCQENNIKMPRLGIVPDDNPNAFCFGWTRNKSHLVITRGIQKYCDKEEQKAVIGHELGHIVHNDFVVMTIIGAIPVLFYVVFRGCIMMMRYSRGGGRGKGNAMLFVAATAAISFVVYLLSQMIALLVSRYREYWADEYSAIRTKNPNALSSALVKIAYGLATEGLGERSDKEHHRHENTFMIFNAKMARSLATTSADRNGNISKEKIKEAMSWDLWNTWATFFELQMTHPLPAKRINALGSIAEGMGQMPYVKFDLKKPESYLDDFLKDIFVKYAALLSIPLAFLYWWYTGKLFVSISLFVLILGLCLFAYWTFYRYPSKYTDTNVESLIMDPKASPIKGKAVRVRGKIIGRGTPGLFYSEDMKLDDGTGLLLLDYHQVLRIIDFLAGIFATQSNIGKEVVVEGWYRRAVVPYLEIYKMHVDDRVRKTYTASLKIAASIIVLLLGAFMFTVSSGIL